MALETRCCWCKSPFVQYTQHGLDFWGCSQQACLNRCAVWALGTKKTLLFVPLPRQVEALEAVFSGQFKWILFGGARGGGKSRFLRFLAYYCCLKFSNFQALLLRRTYPELEKSHMRWVGREVAPIGGNFTPSSNPPVVRFRNGAVLEFGHCQDSSDVENYLSAEYNLVLPDELGTFEEDMVLRIASSARIQNPGFKPCIVAATNPGAMWVKDRWITREVDTERYPDYNPAQYHFIQSLLDDNPYPDPDYEAFLNSLDPNTKAAWRYGSWDVFEGQYFGEFSREKHLRRLEIPSDLPRIGGMDWGYTSPGVHLWSVVLPDGHLHVERELKFKETVAIEVGEQICGTNTDYGLDLSVTYADPSMWIRSGQTGESIAETLLRAGVPLYRANHERINGWQRLRHWLRDSPHDGTPWLTFDPDCRYLVRTIPALIHDETHVEDVDTKGDDHAADALRYLVMGRPAPPAAKAKPALPKDSVGTLFQEVMMAGNQEVLGRQNVRTR